MIIGYSTYFPKISKMIVRRRLGVMAGVNGTFFLLGFLSRLMMSYHGHVFCNKTARWMQTSWIGSCPLSFVFLRLVTFPSAGIFRLKRKHCLKAYIFIPIHHTYDHNISKSRHLMSRMSRSHVTVHSTFLVMFKVLNEIRNVRLCIR